MLTVPLLVSVCNGTRLGIDDPVDYIIPKEMPIKFNKIYNELDKYQSYREVKQMLEIYRISFGMMAVSRLIIDGQKGQGWDSMADLY